MLTGGRVQRSGARALGPRGWVEPIVVPLTIQRSRGSVYWVTAPLSVAGADAPIPVVVDTGSFALRTRLPASAVPCAGAAAECGREESQYVGGGVSYAVRPRTRVWFPGDGHAGETAVGVGLRGFDPPRDLSGGLRAQGIMGVLSPPAPSHLARLFGAPEESSVVQALGAGTVTMFWDGEPELELGPPHAPPPFVGLKASPRVLVSRAQHPEYPNRAWFRVHRLGLRTTTPMSHACGDALDIRDVWVMLDSGQTSAVAFHDGRFRVQCAVRRPIRTVTVQLRADSEPVDVSIRDDRTFPSCLPVCGALAGAGVGRGGAGFVILGVQFLLCTRGFGFALSGPPPADVDLSWMAL